MAKPTRLKYQGEVREIKDDKGDVIGLEPDRFYAGVPARDLDEADLAELSSDEVKHLTSGDDPLYVDPDAEREKKAAKKAKKASPPPPPEPEPEPEIVVEPASMSADDVESWPQ